MRIGVVTPAYDVAPWIATAIDSVRAQTHADWRMAVVDDGSRDGTGEIVEGVRDERLTLLRQANAGVSAARNRGMAAVAGCDAVVFLDADDWLAPDALARLAATLAATPDAVAAYGAFAFVPEAARPGDPPVRVKAGPFPDGDILRRLLVENLFANGGHMLVRGDAIARAGAFRADIRFGEDWEYWIRLALLGPFATVPGDAPLLYVRQRSTGAYLRMATDPDAFRPVMAAVFGNPAVRAALGPDADGVRRRTEAENDWIMGRELIRHGRAAEGRARLTRSLRAAPSPRRALLLAAALAQPVLPAALHGPFRRYG